MFTSSKLSVFGITVAIILLASGSLNAQIITLSELSQNFKISDFVTINTSGNFRVTKGQILDTAINASVKNSYNTEIKNVEVSILLCKDKNALKTHIDSMGKDVDFGQDYHWSYSESTSPDSSATDEQFITYHQPIRRQRKARKDERRAREQGILVDTIYHGKLPLPASGSVNVLKGKNIRIPDDVRSGIHHLAIVLSYPDKTGTLSTPRLHSTHYLIIRDAKK